VQCGGGARFRPLYLKFDNQKNIIFFVSIIEYWKNSILTSLIVITVEQTMATETQTGDILLLSQPIKAGTQFSNHGWMQG